VRSRVARYLLLVIPLLYITCDDTAANDTTWRRRRVEQAAERHVRRALHIPSRAAALAFCRHAERGYACTVYAAGVQPNPELRCELGIFREECR